MGSQETSISGSQVSEPGVSEIVSMKGAEIDTQTESAVTLAHAQQHVSLLFALCPKVETTVYCSLVFYMVELEKLFLFPLHQEFQ
mgnify:CR=1 FL=1